MIKNNIYKVDIYVLFTLYNKTHREELYKMYTYSKETLEIQSAIMELVGEDVDIYDALETYEEIIADVSPLY